MDGHGHEHEATMTSTSTDAVSTNPATTTAAASDPSSSSDAASTGESAPAITTAEPPAAATEASSSSAARADGSNHPGGHPSSERPDSSSSSMMPAAIADVSKSTIPAPVEDTTQDDEGQGNTNDTNNPEVEADKLQGEKQDDHTMQVDEEGQKSPSIGEIGIADPSPSVPSPPPSPVPKKHPEMGRPVEQPKILPDTGQYYPLPGTIVDYCPEDGRIPSRFVVRYNHDASLSSPSPAPVATGTNSTSIDDGVTAGAKETAATAAVTATVLQDEWREGDLAAFDSALVDGTNPSAIYNRYTTTSNRIKSQSAGLKLALSNVGQRYNVSVEHTYDDYKRILSILVMMAALEESLQSSLQRHNDIQQIQEQNPDDNNNNQGGRRSTRGSTNVVDDCPKYYTTNPSVYLVDPSKDYGTSQGGSASDAGGIDPSGAAAGAGSKAQMTPTVIAQRVRQGCQWAWTYLQAQQQPSAYLPPPPTMEAPKPEAVDELAATGAAPEDDGAPSERRRSSRAAATVVRDIPTSMYTEPTNTRRSTRSGGDTKIEQPVPTPVHRGGRVALWWLQTLQNGGVPQEMGEEEEEEEEVLVHDEKKDEMDVDAKLDSKASDPTSAEEKTSQDEVGTGESYEPTDDDDDDQEADDDEDFQVEDTDDNDDDEELEGVERERQKLSPVTVVKKKKRGTKKGDADDSDDAGEGDEEEDESEDEEEEIDEEDAIVYSNPYLQPSMTALLESLAGGKSISMEDIQSAMADVTLRVRHNKRFSEFGLIPLNLPACDQIAIDLEDPDHPSRGTIVLKCVSGDTYGDLQRYDANAFGRCRFELDVIGEMEAAVQVQRREAQWKREAEYKERKTWDRWRFRGIQEGYCTWPSWGDAADQWAAEHVVKSDQTQQQTGENGEVESTDNDEALAKSLEESEPADSSGRRRNTRRAAGAVPESVYYGNQSQLTLKQLADALLRLVKATPCQTLMKLLSTVGDDSSDPMRRLRTSIGKMIWKRNLVCRKSVTSTTSDAGVTKSLESGNALLSLASDTEGSTVEISHEDAVDFTNYIQRLHVTELYLRELVLDSIATVPIPIIACAADERPGSMESMDRSDFEDSTGVIWMDSGNDLIGKQIFRPPTEWSLSTDLTACNWYIIKEVSDAVESEADDAEEFAVERRMRFRAVPSIDPGEEYLHDGETLLLTEAQVHAGITAADMELKRQQTESTTHAFANSAKKREKVVLIPNRSGADQAHPVDIHGQIVSHDTCANPADPTSSHDRILILPSRNKGDADGKPAFWAVLGTADDGSAVCTRENDTTVYTIENSKYGPDSEAFQMCHEVIEWIKGNPKIVPFLLPVDPVALGIPSYFDIIKHPMDISTVEEKLEKGVYSNFAPSESRGKRFPVSLMLNGPFRDDVELIFSNAQEFNPEDDWIHKAAKSLKQAFLRKIRDITSRSEAKAMRSKNPYTDDDSDFDMQELDDDDEEYGRRGGRKRKRGGRSAGAVKDEPAAKAIEHPIRLQNSLRGGDDLRGPFARLPVTTDANSFSLPEIWTCIWSAEDVSSNNGDGEDENETETKMIGKKEHASELEELLSLQQAISEDKASRLRRSTRAHDHKAPSARVQNEKLEFVLLDSKTILPSWHKGTESRLTTRLEVEIAAEKRHEEHYSSLYQLHEKALLSHSEFGKYSPSSFPPYLGRVIPGKNGKAGRWEIRSSYVVPALRWVIRGLIQSGHLTALEPMTNDPNSGVILANDVYYYDPARKPFEVLDTRELQRKKRSDVDAEDESEEEVELSEYEQLRAERMARNQERLRMLGLA
eukprot:CAMPEP_0113454018 /NCGR_PEP_ID=MMETSP0014_2-20120614/7651_1 /TAXON_ID=2857 /ORGANISM="Nitzschia sp." /LENGTH=1788 /DNA_ID=CAMNT_0000345419 /DNA_START=143 /DNA_END=5509 /DNA_ORIENTATION=- /assembly_acc=CAM_ASM_000159